MGWTGWIGIALGLGALAILTWTARTRTPAGGPWSLQDYEGGWREAMVGTIGLYDDEGQRQHTV